VPAAAGARESPGLRARLLTPLSTYTARRGWPVAAEVTTPLCEGTQELPRGTVLEGSVMRVARVGLGLIHETAGLELHFRLVRLSDGRVVSSELRLSGVENARERVDSRGKIHGERSTATWSNRAGERIAFAVMKHPYAMIPLFAVESGFLHFPDPEIEYPAGTGLDLEIVAPEGLGVVSPCPTAIPALGEGDRQAVNRAVAELPYWSYSRRQPQPMDLVNLVFVGSRSDLEHAFAAAGWTGSAPNSVRAGMNAVRAIAQDTGFAEAPMRTLLLDGAKPELRLQKSLNTFEKRDHLRIWSRGILDERRQVWASAATRDVAATFSVRPFGFTHQIEDEVDRERDAVVADLEAIGCVAAAGYVARSQPIRAPGQPYRRGVITDGRIAVVDIGACDAGPPPAADEAFRNPGWLVRSVRRIALTGRNRLLRDNIVWRSADGVRIGIRTLRTWKAARRDENRARALAGSARPPISSGAY